MRILIVEDDRKAAQLLAKGLREEGLLTDVRHSAEEAALQLREANYDLIVLDWVLPKQDGKSLCAQLRAQGVRTPVLLLTARDALHDRVAGLNSGADDYLTKPFAFEELLARVRALLRRSAVQSEALRYGGLLLDPVTHQVARDGESVQLTRKEYAILELLIRQAGEVVDRARIAERIWESDLIALDNLIDVHISNLRKKLDVGAAIPLIQTVRGRGFRLGAAPA